MTFSLKSSFNWSDKRSLLITADKAVLYQCRNGQLDVAYEFPADEVGRENFMRCLAETSRSPIYILVDIVEEEYRQDVIPHVSGSDRKAVLERKFARLFRGTNYCHAIAQGRETDGRKDDKVLLTAITKPDIVQMWVGMIEEQKIPIAGIYSLPVLSEFLLKKIGAKGPNVLLISVQSASGLRQTFFRDRRIKISRLAQMPRIGSVPYASHLMGELEKLRRYLNSLALVSREGPLEVYILSHGEWLTELEQHCRDTDDEKYYLVDVADLAARLGVKNEVTSAYADTVFNQLLLDTTPKNHYATKEESKYYSLYRSRNGLMIAGVLLLLASVGWSGFNFLDAVSLKQQALEAQQKANFYQERYAIARQNLPPTPVEPLDIKTAVDIVETLEQYKSDPLPMLNLLGRTLETSPAIRLGRIEWYSALDPNKKGETETRRHVVEDKDRIEKDPAYSHYHVAVFRARLTTFAGDYRDAIAQADRLAEKLREQNHVRHVEVLEYPLDVAPDANLTGNTVEQTAKPEAWFAIKVILGVVDGRKQS